MILLRFLLILSINIHFCQSQNMQRVAGGINAKESDWKFNAALFYRKSTNRPYEQLCSGAIINKWQILTAAHCMFTIEKWTRSPKLLIWKNIIIVPGKTKIHRWHLVKARYVADFIVHPKYNHSAKVKHYDIAILKVNKAFKFDGKVEAIPLQDEESEIDDLCHVAGWGSCDYSPQPACCFGNKTKIDSFPTKLHTAQVPIWSTKQCQSAWQGRNIRVDKQGILKLDAKIVKSVITERNICFGGKATGTNHWHLCLGDSGGPLVCKDKKSRLLLVGLNSWGHEYCNCEVIGTPNVNTRISPFKEWIEENVWNKSQPNGLLRSGCAIIMEKKWIMLQFFITNFIPFLFAKLSIYGS